MEEQTVKTRKGKAEVTDVKVNPLRNERIYVRFVPNKFLDLPKNHPAWGGMMDGSSDKLSVPVLRSGKYKNILTNDEKDFLEEALGLDYNALSVYRTENNFWDNYHVYINKEGITLDLSNPEDFIRYKVLLANSDVVAPSVEERMNRPKLSYRYEIVRENEESDIASVKMDAKMACYKEFGKIDEDLDTMRVLCELADSRPYDINSSREFFRARIDALIQANPKMFLRQITDPMLHTKVLLRRGVELGKISKRGDYYYLKSDGSPLCDAGEDPTLSVAAKYLNLPSHQDIKFLLESEVGNSKKK